MLQEHGYRANASRAVPVYVPAFASTNLYCLATETHKYLAFKGIVSGNLFTLVDRYNHIITDDMIVFITHPPAQNYYYYVVLSPAS